MNGDAKRWRTCAWLRDLVLQWHLARGYAAPTDFQRPFSRDWEELLETAGLLSAEARNEALRDAHVLQAAGLVDLRTERYRPYQIERVLVPFAAEARLRELFSNELPGKPEPAFDPRSVAWASQLSFLAAARITVAPDDLLKLNRFLLSQPNSRSVVPIKERSLEIFGDEKRLDALLSTSLFRHGRLDIGKDLWCEIVGEPLAWKRGPMEAAAQPLIVIENAATWHSYCRWNGERKLFSAVVYGCGNRFVDGIRYLDDIFAELGDQRGVFYFGDLDPQGLRIPQLASASAEHLGLPRIEAHLASYSWLLQLGSGKATLWDGGEPARREDCDWLGEVADEAWAILSAGNWLAQERVGWEFLASMGAGI
jgi:hypothetical protein